MNTNEIIGRACRGKIDHSKLKASIPTCLSCGVTFCGFDGDHCIPVYPFDTDHNAIAHARAVLLDTDEKRADFARVLHFQLDLPDWDHPDFAELLDYCFVDASPADQSKAMIEALGLEGK